MLQVPKGALGIKVEPELGELHGYLAAQVAPREFVDEPDVVLGNVGSLVDPGHVLAQAREHRPDAQRFERGRCRKRSLGVFAGHEAADRAAREPQSGEVHAEPRVPGHPEEHVP